MARARAGFEWRLEIEAEEQAETSRSERLLNESERLSNDANKRGCFDGREACCFLSFRLKSERHEATGGDSERARNALSDGCSGLASFGAWDE